MAGQRFSAERCAELRKQYLDGVMSVYMQRLFKDNLQIQCVGLAVAQYWDDEANDAVHLRKYPCEHAELDLEALFAWNERNYDQLNLDDPHPHMPSNPTFDTWDWERKTFGDGWYRDPVINNWNDNYDAISLFGGFVAEEGSQEWDDKHNYSLFCVYRKDVHGDITWEYTTEMHRPYVDGCWPSWASDEDGGTDDPNDGPMIKIITRYKAVQDTMDVASTAASTGLKDPDTQAHS